MAIPGLARSQSTPTPVPAAYVEALSHANVRSGPGTDFPQVGTINAGTTYPMLQRSSRLPWYLIALPDTQGWVFADLVKVTGNLKAVPVNDSFFAPGPTLATTATAQSTQAADSSTGVSVEAKDTSNVRYGPGTDFPRVGTINKGDHYAVTRRHALYPWLEIEYPDSPSGLGWVFKDTVNISGPLANVPVTQDHIFGYPTLTPTPDMVVTSAAPWKANQPNQTGAGPALAPLGATIYDLLLKGSFEPGTDRQGSVFIMDLRTGQNISLNPGVAYSGVSMMKIAVLLSLYRKMTAPPTATQAKTIGEMMVCSENTASNAVLRFMGNNQELQGSRYVTETLRMLGIKNTYLSRPFFVGTPSALGAPTATPDVENALKTTADQASAEPDLYNQTTPADLGWLLAAVYQCAVDGSGPIASTFNGDVTMMECRHIVDAMRADKIGTLVEAGVPLGLPVAHKHGWSDDTHGDAALLTTPGGDYVLVAILHNQGWLKSEESFPLVAEISRLTYNTFNPTATLDKTHLQNVPADCSVGDDLITSLQTADLPPIR